MIENIFLESNRKTDGEEDSLIPTVSIFQSIAPLYSVDSIP